MLKNKILKIRLILLVISLILLKYTFFINGLFIINFLITCYFSYLSFLSIVKILKIRGLI